MSTVTEIQQAILALSEADYAKFRKWFTELDWERWDREIEADSEAGKLDFLIAEALEAKEKGTLADLWPNLESRLASRAKSTGRNPHS